MPNWADTMAESKRGYRWDAELYAKHSGSQYAWALELIDKLKLKGDECVLDVGCGDGKVTAAIAERLSTGSVTGIDSSAAMIELAKRRHAGGGHGRLDFKRLDVRELDERERFDVAFSNAALHWVKRHPPVLQRVQQSLKSGGRILFQMGGRGNAEHVVAVLDAMINGPWAAYFGNFEFPYGFHGPAEYAEWLADAGLMPVRIDLIDKDMRHNGRDGFAGWIGTTWLPYLERIPDHRRDAFMDALIDEYLRRHPMDGAGIVHVLMRRLEVEAVKP
jgi:trans-aconitate 2-methyltransferase